MKIAERFRVVFSEFLCCGLILLALSNCAHFREQDSEKRACSGDRKAKEDAFLHGAFPFFPASWSLERKAQSLSRIKVRHHHGASNFGCDLGHAQLEVPAEELDAILQAQQQEQDYFSREKNPRWEEHAFGENSSGSFPAEDGGSIERLSWWEPGKCEDGEYVYWSVGPSATPPNSNIYLQISEGAKGRHNVFARFESE